MTLAETHLARQTTKILQVNLNGEKDTIDFYEETYRKAAANRGASAYEFETLNHPVRHVITGE